MATLEDEVKYLREINKELARKVQHWKITAADRENDRIALMKENNDLRLKLNRYQKFGGLQARNSFKLDVALQAASEKTLSYLIKASEEIARSMELAKAYIRDQQELDAHSPRWSSLSATPNSERKDKVHRVPPMMMGGHSIQPVVALSRTLFNTSSPITTSRIANQTHSTQRAVPMHMLQDVYIPLTRIDASELRNYNMDNNADDSTEELGLDDSSEKLEDAEEMSDDEDYEGTRLDVVTEELEPEHEIETTLRNELENPLEGPSWLLDTPGHSTETISRSNSNLEPDSTTELTCTRRTSDIADQKRDETEAARCEFTPTVRRRKRTSSPPPLPSPRLSRYSQRPLISRRSSNSGRVLKVLVAKMRFDGEDIATVEVSPPKRLRSPSPAACPAAGPSWSRDGDHSPSVMLVPFDAPSPNGATDSAVIVSDTLAHAANMARRDSWGSHCSQLTKPNNQRSNKHTRKPSFDSKHNKSLSQHNRPEDQQNRSDNQQNRSNGQKNGSDAQQKGSDSQQNRSDRQQNRSDDQQNRSDGQHSKSDDKQNISDNQQNRSDGQQNISDNQQNRSDAQQNKSGDQHDISEGPQYSSVNPHKESDTKHTRSQSEDRSVGQRKLTSIKRERQSSTESQQDSTVASHQSRDSDSCSGGDSVSEGRTRRPRKLVTYKEKPLNRKLRR